MTARDEVSDDHISGEDASTEYAVFYSKGHHRRVEFSNGQPAWERVSGRKIGAFNAGEVLALLEADGWSLVSVLHNGEHHYQRPSPQVPFDYEEYLCTGVGDGLGFHPGNAAEARSAIMALMPAIEAFLQPFAYQGWERDPHPSAIDPQLSARLFGRWRLTGVKVRLRRPR